MMLMEIEGENYMNTDKEIRAADIKDEQLESVVLSILADKVREAIAAKRLSETAPGFDTVH